MLSTCSVKHFQPQPLTIGGAEIVVSPVYTDIRGSLYESIHVLKMKVDISMATITGMYPVRKVVYGPTSHLDDELVYLIRGKVLAFLIDPKDHTKQEKIELVPGHILKVPAGVIHAFLSVEDNTIFDIVRTSTQPSHERFPLDIISGLIPDEEQPVVQASTPQIENVIKVPRFDYAIMGSNGMIGSSFVREIEKRGQTWCQIRSRLNMVEGIKNEIIAINPRISVIIAAGVGTRPNTKWCEDHRLETIDINVTSQLNVAKICKDLGYHCTLIGTSGFYHYNETHTLDPSSPGFTEDDPPNHECNFYYQMRVFLEKLLAETGLDSNTLNLRALFPFNHVITTASLIGKLLRFSVIRSIPTSMTVLDDLVPLALDMMEDHDVGNVNWNAEGTFSNGDLLRMYQKIVDPEFKFNEELLDVKKSKETGNSAAKVEPARLKAKFGDRVPTIENAVKHVMELIKANKQ